MRFSTTREAINGARELRAEYAVPAEDPVPHTPFEPAAHLRRPR